MRKLNPERKQLEVRGPSRFWEKMIRIQSVDILASEVSNFRQLSEEESFLASYCTGYFVLSKRAGHLPSKDMQGKHSLWGSDINGKEVHKNLLEVWTHCIVHGRNLIQTG